MDEIEYDIFGQSAVETIIHLHLRPTKRHRARYLTDGLWGGNGCVLPSLKSLVNENNWHFLCLGLRWNWMDILTWVHTISIPGVIQTCNEFIEHLKSGNLLSELYIYIMESTATCLALWGTYTKGRARSGCFASLPNGALSSFCYVLWQVLIPTCHYYYYFIFGELDPPLCHGDMLTTSADVTWADDCVLFICMMWCAVILDQAKNSHGSSAWKRLLIGHV